MEPERKKLNVGIVMDQARSNASDVMGTVNARNARDKDFLNANDAKARVNVLVVMVEDISVAKTVGAKEKSTKIMDKETPGNKMCPDIKHRAISVLATEHQPRYMSRHR